MKKAVFFSLLIHALIMVSLWQFLPVVEIRENYRPVSIFLIPSESENPVRSEVVEPPVPHVPQVIKTTSEEPRVNPEIQSVPPTQIEPVVPGTDDSPVRQDMPFSTDTKVRESVIVDNGKLPAKEIIDQADANSDENSGMDLEDTIDSSGNENVLEISWSDGRERTLLNGEDPVLAISRNAMLMDQVLLDFSVNQDGTVSFVKIRSPGSLDLRVDRQLLQWARLLLFSSVLDDDPVTSGVIRINLIARESQTQ